MKINEAGLKFAYSPGSRSITTHLILHHAAGNGSVEGIHKDHLGRGWAGIGYHYYVRKDGTIWRGRPEAWQGGHTQGYNYCSIGICAEGNFENEGMTLSQKLAIAELVGEIRIRYPGILVCKHSSLQATACPGRSYPFDDIVNPKTQEPQDKDVETVKEPSSWAAEACKQAIESGLFKGDEHGDFHWRESITRQELAVVLGRLELGCKCRHGDSQGLAAGLREGA